MTWNKTDDSAVAPDEPASSWIAQRILTNTDDHTRENRTWVTTLPYATDTYPTAPAGWLASNTPRIFPIWVPLSPETDEIKVTLSGETRRLLADVEVDVGYGLSRGSTTGWTGYRTFSSGPGVIDEETFTLDVSRAHLDQLREIPILIRIRSLESTEPAAIDIAGGFAIRDVYATAVFAGFAPDVEKWWTVIDDDTGLAGFNRDDAFVFDYSGTKITGKGTVPFTGQTFGSANGMIHYISDENGAANDNAAFHVYPAQDSTVAGATVYGALDIHITLLGMIRFHAIQIEQESPFLSVLPYPGVNPTPLKRTLDAFQAVAPDMPTRYQTDLLTHRAQKYLVAQRPPIISIGPTGDVRPPFASSVVDGAAFLNLDKLLLIPLDPNPTRISLGSGVRERKSLDVVLWLTAWGRNAPNDLAPVTLRTEMLEIDTTALATPSYSPAFITHHTQDVSVEPPTETDFDEYRLRVKGFPSSNGSTSNYPTVYTALQPLWDRWRTLNRQVIRVGFTITDPVAGNAHDYLRFSILDTEGDASDRPRLVQCVGWYVTEARGQAWDTTTEAT